MDDLIVEITFLLAQVHQLQAKVFNFELQSSDKHEKEIGECRKIFEPEEVDKRSETTEAVYVRHLQCFQHNHMPTCIPSYVRCYSRRRRRGKNVW